MQQLDSVLAELAKKFNVTADQLWSVMVAQAKIEAILGIISFTASSIAVYLCYCFFRWSFERVEWKDRYYDDANHQHHGTRWEKWDDESSPKVATYGTTYCVITIAVLIFFVICLVNLYWVVTALVNPQYWALKQIIR